MRRRSERNQFTKMIMIGVDLGRVRRVAYRYSIDSEKRRVEISFEGTLSPDDIAGLRSESVADPQFDPAFDQLIDGRAVSSLEGIGAREVQFLASNRAGVHAEGARRAFVVSTDVGFGLSRMFQGLSNSDGDVRVFRDYDQALAWLDGQ